MNSQFFPEIRNDDVLQVRRITVHQALSIGTKDLLTHFLEADELFKKYDYPCTLAIVAEGIEYYPYWVKYIKKNIHRYKIELHGLEHKNYRKVSYEEFISDNREAIAKIEKAFKTRVTIWYPPFGRKGQREPEDCNELGITQYKQIGKVDAKLWLKNPEGYPHINFHYWYAPQVETIKRILCQLPEPN